jgi:hypothetical protein
VLRPSKAFLLTALGFGQLAGIALIVSYLWAAGPARGLRVAETVVIGEAFAMLATVVGIAVRRTTPTTRASHR